MKEFNQEQWLSALRPGDRVGVYECNGTRLVYEDVVSRRTPSGRIVLFKGSSFKPDGYLWGQSAYADRHLGPVQPRH